mmetsp:Transcript_20588/g.33933  ORF Transcript_20588/g.33933 Transcript_20588/m.33933 type:complete len:497 (+) Transcript_20588:37-1527(+)
MTAIISQPSSTRPSFEPLLSSKISVDKAFVKAEELFLSRAPYPLEVENGKQVVSLLTADEARAYQDQQKLAKSVDLLKEARQLVDDSLHFERRYKPESFDIADIKAQQLKNRAAVLLKRIEEDKELKSTKTKSKLACGCLPVSTKKTVRVDADASRCPLHYLPMSDAVSTLTSGARKRATTIVFLGNIYPVVNEQAPEAHFELKSLLNHADMIVTNINAPVINVPLRKKYRGSDMSIEFVRDLFSNLDIDPRRTVVSVANDRTKDNGGMGLLQTLACLRHLGLRVVGSIEGGPLFLRVNHKNASIGFCGWTHYQSFLGSIKGGKADVVSLDILESKRVDQQKQTEKIDILIGYPHWGGERTLDAEAKLKDTATRLMGEKDFDLIVGHGPRTLQPTSLISESVVPEEYASSSGAKKVCAFALGDVTSSKRLRWVWKLGAMLEVVIVSSKIVEVHLHPYFRDLNPETGKEMLVPIQHIAIPQLRSQVQDYVKRMYAEM